ncbi:flavin reductase family protein [Pseudonocardia acaciae]|uniref:flavin reductase family protein n=1 Tax=Pseudonocardia acaciae TaxID=551276 RepID=UPI000688ACE6|nr:flavin reductase family protein [Pseudonocardia acaciae]
MELSPKSVPLQDLEHVINAIVVPRPIAWITTTEPSTGVHNLAPFSYYNAVSMAPPVISVAFSPKGKKDTLENIRSTGEFVVNVPTHELGSAMVASSDQVAADVDEIEMVGLSTAPSAEVLPPRLGESPVSLECRLDREIGVYDCVMVLGEVVHVHVDESVMANGRVAVERLHPVGRLGGSLYTHVETSYRMRWPSSWATSS